VNGGRGGGRGKFNIRERDADITAGFPEDSYEYVMASKRPECGEEIKERGKNCK